MKINLLLANVFALAIMAPVLGSDFQLTRECPLKIEKQQQEKKRTKVSNRLANEFKEIKAACIACLAPMDVSVSENTFEICLKATQLTKQHNKQLEEDRKDPDITDLTENYYKPGYFYSEDVGKYQWGNLYTRQIEMDLKKAIYRNAHDRFLGTTNHKQKVKWIS